MTDTLKFRAFCKEDNEYREVLSINFNKGFVILDMGWADEDETIRWDALFWFKDIILEQYTGINDKNEVEIFEGDILSSEYYSYIEPLSSHIEVVESISSEKGKNIGKKEVSYYSVEYEVIGNINENSDMLKGDK